MNTDVGQLGASVSCGETSWLDEGNTFSLKERERDGTSNGQKRVFLGLEGKLDSLRHLGCCSTAAY